MKLAVSRKRLQWFFSRIWFKKNQGTQQKWNLISLKGHFTQCWWNRRFPENGSTDFIAGSGPKKWRHPKKLQKDHKCQFRAFAKKNKDGIPMLCGKKSKSGIVQIVFCIFFNNLWKLSCFQIVSAWFRIFAFEQKLWRHAGVIGHIRRASTIWRIRPVNGTRRTGSDYRSF